MVLCWTLCGFQFAQDGSAVTPSGGIGFGKAPYRETGKRVVNCPRCVEIVRICKTVEVEDLPEPEQQPEPETKPLHC